MKYRYGKPSPFDPCKGRFMRVARRTTFATNTAGKRQPLKTVTESEALNPKTFKNDAIKTLPRRGRVMRVARRTPHRADRRVVRAAARLVHIAQVRGQRDRRGAAPAALVLPANG